MKNEPYGLYERFLKRVFDIILALIILTLFGWLYIIIAVLVKVKLGSPVIFCQERPGKNEKIFKLYKFRTMTDQRDEKGDLLPDEMRLTKFGKILRSTSLDELPEIFNILLGDMSFIGPRPLLISYLPYYTEKERHRHDVRPGLSGLAQVNGRNSVEWERRFQYDIQYVNRITFLGDVKIVLKCVQEVLMEDDVGDNTNAVEGNFAEIRKKEIKYPKGKEE